MLKGIELLCIFISLFLLPPPPSSLPPSLPLSLHAQRWSKRYMAVTADHLYISKEKGDKLREEIFLKDVTVAENSTKNINHSFTVS